MKNFLKQLGQWILKYKKKLIYGALALFIGQICFFGLGGIGVENEVFADDNQTQSESSQEIAAEKISSLQLFHKIIYVCIYPILIVAGKVVDNSLVYGEIFGFDTVLWQLWIIVRNIANFTLGFIFIFYIFKYLITQDQKHGPKRLIIRALIAGVGIQASWFIMAALIDISTIVTYGVGGLPMSVLKTDEDSVKYNPYILSNVVYIEADKLEDYHMYLSNQSFLKDENKNDVKFISECETFSYSYTGNDGNSQVEELILAPQMIYYMDDSNKKYYPTEKLMCAIGDEVYRFSNLYESGNDGLVWQVINSSMSGSDIKDNQSTYRESINKSKLLLKQLSTGDMISHISNGNILEIGDAHGGTLGEGTLGVLYGSGKMYGLDVSNVWMGSGESSQWHLPHLGDILTGNYAGVFSALYGSLLNAGINLRLSSVSDNGIYVKLLNTALSVGHMIAIAIPLLVMVVVLVMRIGILWMIIVLSPVVVLLKAFEFDKNIDKSSILRFMKFDNLLGVVFSPAIICFAVSLSTVLVRIINAMNRRKIETGQQDILGGLIQLNLAGLGINLGKLVGSVIGIAITRFLMWAAVESSELGKTSIVKNLKELSSKALGSMEVIPVPGKDGKTNYLGVSTVFGGNGQEGIVSKLGNKIKGEYETRANETFDQWLDPDKAGKEAEKNRGEKYKEGVMNLGAAVIQGNDWTTIPIAIGDKDHTRDVVFNSNLINDASREAIISGINGSDEATRKSYGGSARSVKIGTKTYIFRDVALIDEAKKDVSAPYQYMTDDDYKNYLKEKNLKEKGSS